MTDAEKLVDRFFKHNKDSKIVRSEWLGKDKQPPTGGSETWLYKRVTLEDGTVYTLDFDAIKTDDRRPEWGHPS